MENRELLLVTGRVQAARKLGMDLIPTIELAYLSETQRQAYIIADNKLAENAGWDAEMLRLELGDSARTHASSRTCSSSTSLAYCQPSHRRNSWQRWSKPC